MTNSARQIRRAAGKKTESTSSHSVRTPNETWARAQAQARRLGVPMNRVIIELLEGFARGQYLLPKRETRTVRVYAQEPAAAAAAVSTPTQ